MSSYENDIINRVKQGQELPSKIDISTVKYFWQAGPFAGSRKDNVPKFLRSIDTLKNFSDHELRVLSKYLHLRSFSDQEVVFRQFDPGVGFYFLFKGHVDVVVKGDITTGEDNASKIIISLEKGDYFGELALLQENSVRSATVVSRDCCQLLGIFKPDVEELIKDHPIIATKLLQTVSVIIANRLYSVTKAVGALKIRISQLEQKLEMQNELLKK